jgi:hypothetical protein
MKRLILLACTVFLIIQASAQNQPKTYFITAGIGGSIKNDDNGTKNIAYNLAPGINYMLSENWSIGVFAAFGQNITKSTSTTVNTGTGYYTIHRDSELKETTWYVGPQVRYFYPVTDKLFFFGEAQAGYQDISVEGDDTGYMWVGTGGQPGSNVVSENRVKSNATSLQAYISPGLVYFLKPKFGLELKMNMLQYNYGLEDSRLPGGESESRNFGADFSLANSSLGASFYF